MTGAVGVPATWIVERIANKVAPLPAHLFCYSQVAANRRVLAAKVTPQHRKTFAAATDRVVTGTNRRASAPIGSSFIWRDKEVCAQGRFAEIHCESINGSRQSRRTRATAARVFSSHRNGFIRAVFSLVIF